MIDNSENSKNNKRKISEILNNLEEKIKKSKNKITSSDLINMGKIPTNKDKMNIIFKMIANYI